MAQKRQTTRHLVSEDEARVAKVQEWGVQAALQATSWKALSHRSQQLASPALSSRLGSWVRCFSSPTRSMTAFEGQLCAFEDRVIAFIYGAPRLISRVSGVSSCSRSVFCNAALTESISILLSPAQGNIATHFYSGYFGSPRTSHRILRSVSSDVSVRLHTARGEARSVDRPGRRR